MKTGRLHYLVAVLSAFLVFGQSALAKDAPAEKETEVTELSWDKLAPPVEEDMIKKYEAGEITPAEAIAYVTELGKVPVQSLNETRVRVPGYLVPLNIRKDQTATELLLVPTLGACIHVPPPPPNQTIFIRYPEGIKVTEAGYTPYWVEGVIKVERNESEYTEVLYAITPDSIIEYE
ncbi:DUF3299 domain-containing protein [Endozoicomonas ascidiicola]|uniref:DUF3299 domain-containing protein n=1 Tax=Endozoicomonas ascidiicola TaxID=1698521 RepID=UPI00082DB925|nr:DUF3299 domain-containing protein [Endozoicomonas ascidiicola]